jgi:hypothetical protein
MYFVLGMYTPTEAAEWKIALPGGCGCGCRHRVCTATECALGATSPTSTRMPNPETSAPSSATASVAALSRLMMFNPFALQELFPHFQSITSGQFRSGAIPMPSLSLLLSSRTSQMATHSLPMLISWPAHTPTPSSRQLYWLDCLQILELGSL